MQLDYRATLDEKEELASDRDYYKSKVMRLNHQISAILNRSKASEDGNEAPKPIIDVDTVVNENKYLHERVTQLQVEKEIVKRNLAKYKVIIYIFYHRFLAVSEIVNSLRLPNILKTCSNEVMY